MIDTAAPIWIAVTVILSRASVATHLGGVFGRGFYLGRLSADFPV